MKASEHPSFKEEEKHLEETIRTLETNRDEILSNSGGDYLWAPPDTIRIMSNNAVERVQKCKHALQDLYFGRVDWKLEGNEDSEQFYIGLTEYYPHIYAWQDTLAADLYYNRSTDREKGTLQLIRAIQIVDRKLLGIEDQFKDPSLTGELEPDSLLAILLQESRGQLHEIVATINAQQYRIIRSPLNSALIVQGVPGSGKTVIALHRVSFLLYNNKELRNQNVVVLGPNPLFMQYVSRVLPSLGDKQIPQKTFDQWVIDQLGENLSYQSQEELLEFLLSSENLDAEKIMHLRNCQNMGSLKMGRLLERYIEFLRNESLTGKSPLVCRYYSSSDLKNSPITIEKTVDQIRIFFEDVSALPFNKQRDAVKLKLANQISSEIVSKLGIGFQAREQKIKQVFQQIKEQIDDYFASWRSLNASIAFRRLFRQRELLHKFGEGLFSKWDLELMAIDAPTPQSPFRFSDLAGLLYFNVLLNGIENQTYGHIVVDEAQDIPALFFEGLSRYVPQKSITILGDIGQGIFINNGLSSWNDLYEIFPNLNNKIEELNVCYRSTWQIMQNANNLLRRSGLPEDQLIRPLNRLGEEVSFYPESTKESLVERIVSCIQDDLKNEWKSIAIICRSAHDCQVLAQGLQTKGFNSFDLIDHRNRKYNGGVAILPTYLSKGLEFDAVILADGQNYPLDNLSARLLFVAITRAAHKLDICWVGDISPLLDNQIDRINVKPFLDNFEQEPITLEQYSESRHLDPDGCVEQIARTGRLPLMSDGMIDPVLMDMVIRTSKSTPKSSSEDILIIPLKPEEESTIHALIQEWEGQATDEIRDSLVLIQTVFGLLKNHLRNLTLIPVKDRELSLPEQVTILVRLKRLLEDANLSLPAGRGAGKKRLLEDINPEWQTIHATIVDTLVDYGLLEVQITSDERSLIRISPDWIKVVLDFSLGFPPSELDPDLIQKLPHLPKAIDVSLLINGGES